MTQNIIPNPVIVNPAGEAIIVSREDLDAAFSQEEPAPQLWGYCSFCGSALYEDDCIDPDNDTFECGQCDTTFHCSEIVTPEDLYRQKDKETQ